VAKKNKQNKDLYWTTDCSFGNVPYSYTVSKDEYKPVIIGYIVNNAKYVYTCSIEGAKISYAQ